MITGKMEKLNTRIATLSNAFPSSRNIVAVTCGRPLVIARRLLPEKDSKIVGEDDGESDLRRTRLCAHHS